MQQRRLEKINEKGALQKRKPKELYEKNRLAAQERQRKAKAEALQQPAKAEKSRMKRLLERKQKQMNGTRRDSKKPNGLENKLWNETNMGRRSLMMRQRHLRNFKKQNQKTQESESFNEVAANWRALFEQAQFIWAAARWPCSLEKTKLNDEAEKMVTCPII